MKNKVELLKYPNFQCVHFYCPGCGERHELPVVGDSSKMPVWGWNQSLHSPTLTPSILARFPKWHRGENSELPQDMICHSFVTDGRIQFLGDCTHELANQTVDLPDLEEAIS